MSTIPNTLPYGGDIVKDYVDDCLKKKADKDEVKISTSASGTSFALTDAADAPLAGLVIEGRTTSSGDTITNIGDNGLSVTSCGKNLFDGVVEPGTIDSTTGKNIYQANRYRSKNYIKVKPNTEYILSYNGAIQKANWLGYTANKIYISQSVIIENDIIQTGENIEYVRFFYDDSINKQVGLQLELGATATAYEPYKGSTAVLSTGLPLCSVGDVKDIADFTAGVVHKRCEKIVLDGSEDWDVYPNSGTSTTGSKLLVSILSLPAGESSIGSLPRASSASDIWLGYNDDVYWIPPDNIRLRISNISTVADLKTYLAANPVTVVYELAEPYDEPMTASELAAYHNLRTFENLTNITCTDSPQMTVDYLIDTENGASIGQVAENMAGFINSLAFVWNTPEMHRMIFRGKYLGNSVSAAQLAAIRDGSFDDLYVGDYWIMGRVTWRIADVDYWLGCGDTAFNSHHLIIVPDTCLYNAKMNDSNITTGGYVGSKMYTTNLNQAKTTINAAFPNLVLTHREYLVNAVSNGKASGGAWLDSTIELMNENMVYGHREFTPGNDGTTIPINYTIDKSQLALFQIAPKFITNRTNQWLRDVVSAADFADVGHAGVMLSDSASSSRGVRPVFAIG